MRRRNVLALMAAALAAPEVFAPSWAFADDAKQPLNKAFGFLDAYLGLPPGERSRFYLAYRAYRDKRPATNVQAVIVSPTGVRSPVIFDRAGEVAHLPSLAELKSGALFEPVGAPFKLALEARPTFAPSTHVDPAALAASLAQANAAVQKLAGLLAVAVPKVTAGYFPDAGQGQMMLDGGRAQPLPLTPPIPTLGPVPYFEPAASPGARMVVLARAPSRILLGGHPKKA